MNRFPRTLTAGHLVRALSTHRSGANSAPRREQNRYRQLGLPIFAAVLQAVILAVGFASRVQAQQVPERVFNLANSSADGYSPRAGLVQGSDGNFYGTTFAGGASDQGTVFRITPLGVLTTLVEFTGKGATGKGSAPEAELLQGSDGDFYGITSGGGGSNLGTIFRMTAAGVLTSLVEFTGNGAVNKGSAPRAALVQGGDGNFYGTTYGGGANGLGTVFRMTPAGSLTTLVQFTGNGTTNKGTGPGARLVQGSDGSFYGTTSGGGVTDHGTIFRMTPAGVLTTLVEFAGNGPGAKGKQPEAGLVQGSDGNFYGTTFGGGASDQGTVFKMTPAGALTTFAEFTGNGATNRGSAPEAELVQGSDGDFYGTTLSGGASNLGTIFKITPTGVLTTLVELTGNGHVNKGSLPYAALVLGNDGTFYGNTRDGGANDSGTIFKMTSAGVLTTLVELTGIEAAPGDLDIRFDPNANGEAGLVLDTVVQPDGKIVIAGSFNLVDTTARNRIARLHANGTVDLSFDAGTVGSNVSDQVRTVVVQPDGKILMGGGFTTVGDMPLNNFARLNGDGSVDTATFNPGTGADNVVFCVAVQPDAKILIGGAFTAVNGQPRNHIARLNVDGTLESEATFNSGSGANSNVVSIAVQADGKILLGGDFTSVNGQTRNYVARLNADGSLESTATFDPGTGANASVQSVAMQADGKIVLGGFFTSVNGETRNRIARLNAGGSLESTTTFNPGSGPDDALTSLAVQADGKILLAGGFTEVDGQLRNRVARLNADGSLESTTTFDLGTGANNLVYSVAVQADGKILLGGEFTSVNGQARNAVARLANDAPSQNLTVSNAAKVQWGRSGAAPEVEQVTFELTTDGEVNWNLLGFGTRIADGWQLTELSLPPNGSIRARGRTSGGHHNGGSGLIEQVAPFSFPSAPAVITGTASGVSPTDATVNGSVNPNSVATSARFEYGPTTSYGSVIDVASPPGSGSQPVAVSAMISGLQPNRSYHYRLVATNSEGTSNGADFTFTTAAIAPLVITGAPTNLSNTGATLGGTVNPNGAATTAVFDYGLTISYGNSVNVTPAPGGGDSPVAVSATLSGLQPNQTYHFRLTAVNQAGVVSGADGTFTTVGTSTDTPPTVTTGAASPITTTGATLGGAVNPNGSAATAAFEYGLTTSYGSTANAAPSPGSATMPVNVSAVLDGLVPNRTYHFRLTATNAGGSSAGDDATFTTAAAPPMSNPPGMPPTGLASLQVRLTPATARWRIQGETTWRRNSNDPAFSPAVDNANGLAVASEYVIEFEPQGGPVPEPQSVRIGNTNLNLATVAYPVGSSEQGSVEVIIKPDEVANSQVFEQKGQWRFLGEDDTAWRNSRDTATRPVGSYVLEFKNLPVRTALLDRAILISPGQTFSITVFYEDLPSVAGDFPRPLDLATATTTEPYFFAGQVQTDSGDGSGYLVGERVVLTAAHVIFNDTKLSFSTGPISDAQLADFSATGVRWRFQRMRGESEPVPITARGSYVLRGYASSRQGVEPGQGTPQSQENDVATIYFNVPAGRGGFGGYLVSDASTEWTLSPRLKTFVSYPLDPNYVQPPDRGKMHATAPAMLAFTKPDGAASHVYRTNAIAGVAGSSGGALCVKFTDERYYPAAVYIGGNGAAIFRGIDADVQDLIRLAENASRGDLNNNNGGIVRIESRRSVATFTLGRLRVNISPAGAVNAGARWRLATESDSELRLSGASTALRTGSYTVVFSDVPGFVKPVPIDLSIENDLEMVRPGAYQPLPPAITTTSLPDGIIGREYGSTVSAINSASSFSAPALAEIGLSINAQGDISGTPTRDPAKTYPATYQITITATNAVGPSEPKTFPLLIREPGTLELGFDLARGRIRGRPSVRAGSNLLGIGQPVTLTAKPKRGSVFAGWTGSGIAGVPSGSRKLIFTMAEFATIDASFIANPFPTLRGRYSGLISAVPDDAASDGLISIVLTRTGAFTGSMQLGGKKYKLHGAFNGSGNFERIIARKGVPPINVQLHLDASRNPPQMTGTLATAGAMYSILAHQGTSGRARHAGRYTLVLHNDSAPEANAMAGHDDGFALIVVSVTGAARVAGKFIQGGNFSAGAWFADDAVLPLDIPLEWGGALNGALVFADGQRVDSIEGALHWLAPVRASPRVIHAVGSSY